MSLKRAHEQRCNRYAPLMRRSGPAPDPAARDSSLLTRFEATLPFVLTTDQQGVWAEIGADMAVPHPMQRLLQGDVGSGKTVVAALAAAQAIDAGYQVALMAPTEILAEQQARKLRGWLEALGRGAAHHRHPRDHPGCGRICPLGPGHRRRAAPLWRAAAARVAGQGTECG